MSFRKSVHIREFIFSVIAIILLLNSISTAYAVSTSEEQKKSIDEDDHFIGSSGDSSFLDNQFFIKVKSSSMSSMKMHPLPENTGIISLNDLNKKHGVLTFYQVVKKAGFSNKESPIFNWYTVKLKPAGKKITKKSEEFGRLNEIMESYRNDANIVEVEQDYFVEVQLIPNDRYYFTNGSWNQSYPDLWGIQKINSSYAWDRSTGSPSIIVADIDTGVDRNHEDIIDNMWVNRNEIQNNNIDDDMNGYVDDYYGWDWVNNDNDPMDDHGHGTHTAGTIAATGNNGIGVVGVNWKSRIMALKFLNSGGSGYLSDAVKALQYAADNGARVSSNSWGSSGTSAMLDDAIQYAHDRGMVTIVAAGNSNGDALDFSPASSDRAITVAASDHNDLKASFSNWGQKIDVAAPGVNILSTRASVNPMCTASRTVGTNYCVVSGTSMATPHVAGLAALILAKYPSLTNEEVRQIIRKGTYDLGIPGKDRDFGYGRIDAGGSLPLADTQSLAPLITYPGSRTVVYGQLLEIKGGITGPDFDHYTLQIGAGRDPVAWIPLFNSTTQMMNGTLATMDTTQLADGFYIFRLNAFDTNGKSYQFQVHDVEVDNFEAGIVSPVSLVSQGIIDVIGSAQTKNGLPFSQYMLEWGTGTSPTSYSASGITLLNNGLQPVSNGKLGTWDTSSLVPGQIYTLRLTVTATNGATSRYFNAVTFDKDLVKGWPKLISRSTGCAICESTPTIADLDNDGTGEVIITSPDNKIYVFRKDGSDFPGFPISVNAGELFTWPANVDDLDDDGKKEIIAASVSASSSCSGCSKVYIIRSDGTFYPGWTNPVHVIAQQAGDGTPTVADLDGDNRKELIVIDPYYKKMHAYKLDGSELAGFPKALPFANLDYPGAPSISDLDNDGIPEIAYGIKNAFYLFDNKGNILPGWPFVAPAYKGYAVNFHSTAANGDIDGDGNLEVVVLAHNNGSCSSTITPIYAWEKNGSLLSQWPMDAGYLCQSSSPLNSPSISDIDNDGKDEAIIGTNTLSIFDMEGKKPIGNGIGANIAPAISDVDGDGIFEFSGVRYNWVQIGNDDGSVFWQRGFSIETRFNSPAVFSDLDANGRMEIAVVQSKLSNQPGDLIAYMWEMPDVTANATNSWPMFNHDPQRSGRLAAASSIDTIPPATSINTPYNASAVSGIINVEIAASDNNGVRRVELYINNVLAGTKTSGPYTFAWDTTLEKNGQYTIQSRAYDTSNNIGVSSTVMVNVINDDGAPTVSIISPSNDSTISGIIYVTVIASDNTGVDRVELYRNGTLVGTKTSSPYTFVWNTTQDDNGKYSLQSKAYDTFNNAGTSQVIEVNVSNENDIIAPTISITYPLDRTTIQRRSIITMRANASDNIGIIKIEFYVNGLLQCADTTDSYTCNWNVPGKRGATYILQAKAFDATGNVGCSKPVQVTSK